MSMGLTGVTECDTLVMEVKPMKLVFENTELAGMREAAKALGVSRMTLHRWINEGKVQAVKVGSYRAIPISEIERLRDDKKHHSRG